MVLWIVISSFLAAADLGGGLFTPFPWRITDGEVSHLILEGLGFFFFSSLYLFIFFFFLTFLASEFSLEINRVV